MSTLQTFPAPEISVVFPVFDEEANLAVLLDEIERALRDGPSYEIVAVDDGSTDGSLALLRDRAADDPRLRVLASPRRSGQSAALTAGLRATRASVVVTLDADLQNDPADIPRLLAALPGHDLVSGVRRRRRDTWVRRISSRLANGVRQRVLDDGVRDVGCSLKAYRRRFLTGLPTFDGVHRFLPALVRFQGGRIREIEVNHRHRLHGRSKYGIADRLGRGIVDLLGVVWLRRRWIDVSAFTESTAAETSQTSEVTHVRDRRSSRA